MIPTKARITLNILLGLTYAFILFFIVSFCGGIIVGLFSIEETSKPLIYGFTSLLWLLFTPIGLYKYQKDLFIQKYDAS